VEALADAVGLRALGFGARMIDILDREVFVSLRVATVTFSSAVEGPAMLDICRRPSLTQIANSFLEPVTGALDTTPNDPISERNIGAASSVQLVALSTLRHDLRRLC
jgi:hypothetical protein